MIVSRPEYSPPSTDCTLWRYMDLAQLLSLLETGCLYFPRSDKFEDPYEGKLSKSMIERIRVQRRADGTEWRKGEQGTLDLWVSSLDRGRMTTYISCWYMNEHESAAMWKLYVQGAHGIALRTTYNTLTRVLEPSPIHIGVTKVQYVDYETATPGHGNVYWPFIYK